MKDYIRVKTRCMKIPKFAKYKLLQAKLKKDFLKGQRVFKDVSAWFKVFVWKFQFGNTHIGECPVCSKFMIYGSKEASLGHRRARADGGSYNFSNLLIICRECNNKQGDEFLHDYADNVKKLKIPSVKTIQKLLEQKHMKWDKPKITILKNPNRYSISHKEISKYKGKKDWSLERKRRIEFLYSL